MHLQRLHLDACFSTLQVLMFCMFINAFLMGKSLLAFVKWSNKDLVGTAMQTPKPLLKIFVRDPYIFPLNEYGSANSTSGPVSHLHFPICKLIVFTNGLWTADMITPPVLLLSAELFLAVDIRARCFKELSGSNLINKFQSSIHNLVNSRKLLPYSMSMATETLIVITVNKSHA